LLPSGSSGREQRELPAQRRRMKRLCEKMSHPKSPTQVKHPPLAGEHSRGNSLILKDQTANSMKEPNSEGEQKPVFHSLTQSGQRACMWLQNRVSVKKSLVIPYPRQATGLKPKREKCTPHGSSLSIYILSIHPGASVEHTTPQNKLEDVKMKR
jgi:hypothetical protein